MRKGSIVEYITTRGVTIRGKVRAVSPNGYVKVTARRVVSLSGASSQPLRGAAEIPVFDVIQVSHWN